jgi:dihydroorotase-like cyclic amidohydrolase
MSMSYDLVIKGGTLVIPFTGEVKADIGVIDGKIAAIGADLQGGKKVVDATGKFVAPGAVDAHFHIGIYRPLGQDAFEETRSSLVGGATTVISYFRTGQHYLNKTGSYKEIFPEVLDAIQGRVHTDVGFHLAPMTSGQVDEVGSLVKSHGIPSYKYYMFYKGFDLAANSRDSKAFTMSEEYDLGHLYSIMEAVASAQAENPQSRVSLSLHCEQSELMRLFIDRVKANGNPQTLKAYSDARPPLTEEVAIGEATTLAAAAGTNINLLHLSSGAALGAARRAKATYPEMDMRCEVTLHHLCLDYESLDEKGGLGGKVNPPIRTTSDNDELWRGVLDGTVSWVASDHACCMEATKGDALWPALPGFGGTALLYPILLSEGHHKRGLPLTRVVELVSSNPAKAYGLWPRKGSMTVGADADLVVLDLKKKATVSKEMLLSGQDHCPFEGVEVQGWPESTILRGNVVYSNGEVIGAPSGEYLRRA